jgi:hypothetical protein
MAEYDNSNSGALFINDRRTKPSHANFKGSCTIKMPNGELVEYWVSGWEKSGKRGPFVSLAFDLKEQKEEVASGAPSSFLSGGAKTAEPAKPKTTIQEDLSDDIPF